MVPSRSSRIGFLDFLRIFAFLSVLGGHKFMVPVQAWIADPTLPAILRHSASLIMLFINAGGAGVVVFFLVSGYIITHVLQRETPALFLIRRVFRIYPLYVVAVLMHQAALSADGAALDLRILIPQLLLVGDFFNTPYALNGVEWTLRVELLFYLLMAFWRGLGLLPLRPRLYMGMQAAILAGCAFLAPLPAGEIWSKGYITIYGPFLLLGSAIYCFEKKQWPLASVLVFGIAVVAQYYWLLSRYQPQWIPAHFAAVGLGVFLAAWALRAHLRAGIMILWLSDLTYGVYLFHNWLFDYFKKWVGALPVKWLSPDVLAVGLLLLFCWLMARTVEKGGIMAGRKLFPLQKPAASFEAPPAAMS